MTSIKKACAGLATETIDKIFSAATEYNALKSRQSHPDGKIDKAGRFYLNKRCQCCVGIRSPSRSHPWSLMVHARTATHVAHEMGVEAHERVIKHVAKLLDNDMYSKACMLFKYDPVYLGKGFASDLGV